MTLEKNDTKKYQRCNQVLYNGLPTMVFPNSSDTDGYCEISVFTTDGTIKPERVKKCQLKPISLSDEILRNSCYPYPDHDIHGYWFIYESVKRVLVYLKGQAYWCKITVKEDIKCDEQIEYSHELQNLVRKHTGHHLHWNPYDIVKIHDAI